VSVVEAVAGIEQHLKAFVASAEQEIAEHLPEVAKVAADAESNPVVLAAASAVHVPEFPELLAAFGSFLTAVDAALGTAKAKAAAEALAAQQQPAEQPPQA